MGVSLLQCSITKDLMSFSLDEIVKATQLTREGRLAEATETIQRALGHLPPVELSARDADPVVLEDVTDVDYREVAPAASRPDAFVLHDYGFGGKRYRYRVYEPGTTDGPRPVMVMLHGCKQNSDDFARGTAMNELARKHGVVVVYPEQLRSENNMGCWSWFEPAHQQRGSGEPAMIASLAAKVVGEHGGDAERVYVAGLSAGGAMALLVAQLYPDVFAAVGVHSGLPSASARDVVTAFAAMRKGAGTPVPHPVAVPAIVFHGSADKTVHPSNGKHIVEGLVATLQAQGRPVDARRQAIESSGKRPATRTVYAAAGGPAQIEHWELAAGPHAWSGGRAAGSFTDPSGPDASEAMLAFFLQHRLLAGREG